MGKIANKIVLIASLLASLVTIYIPFKDSWNKPEKKISVKVYSDDILWPKNIIRDVNTLQNFSAPLNLQSFVYGKNAKLNQTEEQTLSNVSKSIANYLTSNRFPYRTYWFNTAWKIYIKNTGSEKIKEFKISIPGASYYEILNRNNNRIPVKYSPQIDITNLLVNDQITIFAWGDGMSHFGDKKVNILHDGVTVDYREFNTLNTYNSPSNYILYSIISITVFLWILKLFISYFSISITKKASSNNQ